MKGQVSFEYSILFGIVLVLFIVIGTLLLTGLGGTDSTKDQAQNLANHIKARAIQASLASTDVVTSIYVPEQVNGHEIILTIYEDDELLVIEDSNSKEFLARVFLPEIDTVTITKQNAFTINFQKYGNILDVEET